MNALCPARLALKRNYPRNRLDCYKATTRAYPLRVSLVKSRVESACLRAFATGTGYSPSERERLVPGVMERPRLAQGSQPGIKTANPALNVDDDSDSVSMTV